jgi:hypothetical protein
MWEDDSQNSILYERIRVWDTCHLAIFSRRAFLGGVVT